MVTIKTAAQLSSFHKPISSLSEGFQQCPAGPTQIGRNLKPKLTSWDCLLHGNKTRHHHHHHHHHQNWGWVPEITWLFSIFFVEQILADAHFPHQKRAPAKDRKGVALPQAGRFRRVRLLCGSWHSGFYRGWVQRRGFLNHNTAPTMPHDAPPIDVYQLIIYIYYNYKCFRNLRFSAAIFQKWSPVLSLRVGFNDP